MQKHPGRALTVLFGIALGAAVFTSVRLSIHASLDSFTRSMDLIAGKADRVLSQPGGRVPEKLVPIVVGHPSVKNASPMLSTYVRPKRDGADIFLLIGFDPIMDRSLRNWQINDRARQPSDIWLDLIKEPNTLIVGQPLADRYDWQQGEITALEHAYQTTDFRIAGILEPQGLALVEGGRVALTDIATFQEFTGLYGVVDRIDLQLKPDAGERDLADLSALLPAGIVLSSASVTRDSGQAMIRAYQLNLSILSFASLFVGMFLVYSLVALNAASRRHELAVLRSTGASAYLLFLIFLTEGALFGLAGWVVAMPISSILIKYLLHGVSQTISTLFVRVQVDALSLSFWEIALSFVVTVFISVLAALQPAREAMQVSPKEALEISQHGMQVKKNPGKLAVGGLICIALVVPFSLLPGVLNIPLPGYLAILLLFVGFALLAPWFLTRMGRVLSPLLHRAAGTPAYLAGRYIRDSGTRTAVSVGALITAVALFASLVIMIFSFRQTVEVWTYQTVSGDLFLTPTLNEVNEFRHPIPAEAVGWFEALDKQVEIVPNRRYFLTYGQFTRNHQKSRFPEYHFADLPEVGADRKQGVQLARSFQHHHGQGRCNSQCRNDQRNQQQHRRNGKGLVEHLQNPAAQVAAADHLQSVTPARDYFISQFGHGQVNILPSIPEKKAQTAPTRIMITLLEMFQGVENNAALRAVVPHHGQYRKLYQGAFDPGPESIPNGKPRTVGKHLRYPDTLAAQ